MATSSSPFTVLFDACVLYPAPLRDLLIEIATTGLFRARWTNEIHEEWIRSVLRERSDLTREQLDRTRSLMDAALMDCLVEGYEPLMSAVQLPDPNDSHVLAAAIHAGCDAIVTFNLKHFPEATLAKHNIQPMHPDAFIHLQFELDRAVVITSAFRCRGRLKAPAVSPEAYLRILESQSLPKTVSALTPYVGVI